MIDLKSILKQYPNCLSSRTLFKSVLMDKYPENKRTVNILTIMFECGIVQKIKCKTSIGNDEFQGLLLQLENDYGISSEYASECVCIWASAFDVKVQVNSKPVSTSVKHEPIIHAPIEEQVVEGAKSDYEISLEKGNLTIKKFVGFDEEEIIIPNHIDGVPVKTIGVNAFAKCTGVKKIVISEGITCIEDGAFSGCSSLTKVILPQSLQSIGSAKSYNGAFENTAIVEIQLPAELQYIGGCTFQGCNWLHNINMPNKVKTIEKCCFYGCSMLTEVLLPDNLSSIEAGAFGKAGITEINIPVSVRKIGNSAFEGCEKLSQILLHEGLETIENNVFENCKSLCSITIPKSVTSIGDRIFDITGWYQPRDGRMKGWSTRRKNENLVISCYAGSYGLEYARKEGYKIRNAAK